MKNYQKIFFVFALLVAIPISEVRAAHMDYIKISGNGTSKIVKIKCPDGSCGTQISGLKPGKYTFTMCNAQGVAMKVKEKANRTKCSASLRYYQSDVKTPRDPASGLPTGKQSNPVILSKPVEANGIFVASGDVTGDGITFQKIEWTWADGSITAEDDWSAPVAK
ncbi:MAG: hypothetical protein WCH46_02470 [bacterium]